MEASEVTARLQLLRQRDWSLGELHHWFGIELTGDRYPLLQQFLMWDRQSYDVSLEPPPSRIDRMKFELFLQNRQWMSKRTASLAWAVTEASFTAILTSAWEHNVVTQSEAEGVFRDIFPTDFVSNFYKRFRNLGQTIFPSLSVFFNRFHEQILTVLQIKVEPLICPTATVLGERRYATSRDALTGEPMSNEFSVFLETNKPLQLRPDACSWLTYVRHESILGPARLGKGPELTMEQRRLLGAYVR